MSPAAQRLASSKLGIRTSTDKALRASYTPSPIRKPGAGTPTPRTTPKSARSVTPAKSAQTPGTTPKSGSTTEVSSLTDNLLNLPKRPRAQDFF